MFFITTDELLCDMVLFLKKAKVLLKQFVTPSVTFFVFTTDFQRCQSVSSTNPEIVENISWRRASLRFWKSFKNTVSHCTKLEGHAHHCKLIFPCLGIDLLILNHSNQNKLQIIIIISALNVTLHIKTNQLSSGTCFSFPSLALSEILIIII